MAWKRMVGGTVLGVALLVTLPVAAAAKTIRVDDDGTASATGCTGGVAVSSSIQAALGKARPGDTVLICPGTYTGQLTIAGARRTGVTVKAVVARKATLVAPAALVSSSDLVTITSDLVTLSGLRLLAPTAASCVEITAMVAVTGTGATIGGSRIAPRGTDTYGNCGYRTGVEVTDGGTAKLFDNTIIDFKRRGASADGVGAKVTSTRDAIRFLHAGVGDLGPGPLPPSAGVYVSNGAAGKVIDTTIRSRAGSGPFELVLSQGIVSTVGANGFRVSGVTIDDADQGFFLGGSAAAVVQDNQVNGGTIGLQLGSQTGSTVSGNVIRVSGNAIFLDAYSTGNTLTGNDANGPWSADCYDSSGDSAANVQNTWTSNIGDSVPTGICTPPA